jgi:hypothetical protein
MSEPYHFYFRMFGYDWEEHNVIQPLIVLFLHGGIAPSKEIILRQNAIDRGLMQLDLFGNVELTADGNRVLDEYNEVMKQYTFH